MATIQIRKKSNKVWLHIPSDIQEFIISKFYTSIDGLEFQVVEQGQSRRNKYLLGNITVFDDTSGGTAETFSTIEALMLRLEALKYPAFFNEGESLIDAFTDLTDTPSSYTGQADKVVKVKPDETGLEFGDPSGFNLQINEEGETPISNVNRVEFANATVEDLGSGAVKVTPLGGGDTPSRALFEVLTEPSNVTGNFRDRPVNFILFDENDEFHLNNGNEVSLGYILTCQDVEGNGTILVYPEEEIINSDFDPTAEYKILNNSNFTVTIADADELTPILIGGSVTIPQNSIAIIKFLNELGQASVTFQTYELGGGGGAVDSVNGQTGVVVLDAEDVGAISLLGTTVGNPVTNDIEFSSDGVSLKQTVGDIEKEIRFSDDNAIYFRVTNTDTSEENLFTISENSLTISKIIDGGIDFSAIDPTNKFIYAQRQYVDDYVDDNIGTATQTALNTKTLPLICDEVDAVLTGVAVDTQVKGYLIPAGTLTGYNRLVLQSMITKDNGTGTSQAFWKINTTNNYATATQIARTQLGSTIRISPLDRRFKNTGSNLVGYDSSAALSNDSGTSTVAISTTAFNDAVDNYIFIGINPNNASETHTVIMVEINARRKKTTI
jgi:hypothetical protein